MRFTGNATLRNLGPDGPALGDVSFDLLTPPDCTVSPPSPDIVQNNSLPVNTNVFIGRVWSVTCSQAGSHDFTLQVSVAPDPVQGAFDPDTTNNSASAGGATILN
jgi:hypothetical protein